MFSYKYISMAGFFLVLAAGSAMAQRLYWSDSANSQIMVKSTVFADMERLMGEEIPMVTAIAIDADSGDVYWVGGRVQIHRVHPDGLGTQLVASANSAPRAIAVDSATGMLFWAAGSAIFRSNLDGTGVSPLVTGLAKPVDVVLDRAGGYIYWADDVANLIQRARLTSPTVENVLTVTAPMDMDIDPVGQKIYFSSPGGGVERANLDGTGREAFVATSYGAKYLAIDTAARRLYFTRPWNDIQRIKLDGGTPGQLFGTPGTIRSLVIDSRECLGNGVRVNNVCECDEGWFGQNCECSSNECAGARLFMAADGAQYEAPDQGNTTFYLGAGTVGKVLIWFEDHTMRRQLIGIQPIIWWYAIPSEHATGSVKYHNTIYRCKPTSPITPNAPCVPADPQACGGRVSDCIPQQGAGGSLVVNQTRSDYVFADVPGTQVLYREVTTASNAHFGYIDNTVDIFSGTWVDGLHYLAEFELKASPDASGTHELRFVRSPTEGPPGTYAFAPSGVIYNLNRIQHLTVIVPCCGNGIVEGHEECDPPDGVNCGNDCKRLGCDSALECADADSDGSPDDACRWYACGYLNDRECYGVDRLYGDIGGANGQCEPDGVVDMADWARVVDCINGAGFCDVVNADIAGPNSDCDPDGACDQNDLAAVMAAMNHVGLCDCPADPG